MNEGRPYLQMWRGVWVSFCKIAIVSFLPVRYRSDGLYCRMAGTRSSPTMVFIRVGIKYTPVHHMTNTHSHAQVLNLHVHAHTSGPDRHIHNQVIPAHGLESCRACVNLCLSDLLPMRTDRWDPQGTWSI